MGVLSLKGSPGALSFQASLGVVSLKKREANGFKESFARFLSTLFS